MGGEPSECGPASPGGPSEPAPRDKEDKGADSMNAIGASKASISLLEPRLRMVILTLVGRCLSMGSIFMSTLTALMEVMNLEAPQRWKPTKGPR